jgi:coenzyme F420-reducing hydrogenase delta subunit
MCSGRVDLSFVFRALRNGADGVFIGGCWPGECHYITEGNYDALGNLHLGRKLLELVGVNPHRVRLEWIAASEGTRYAEAVDDFIRELKELGPLGEEVDDPQVQLGAVERLVPYVKLVERERLRVPERTAEGYDAFYASEETNQLFTELIGDKLTISRILSSLASQPLSTVEIATALQLNPADVAKHLNRSSRLGLVRYDADQARYVLA